MSPTPQQYVTLQQVDPPGPTVSALLGDGPIRWLHDGGWSHKPRPRYNGFTEWEGYLPATLQFPIILDGLADDRSVEPQAAQLGLMMRGPVGPRREPGLVRVVSASMPKTWSAVWAIQELTEGDVLVREDGQRVRIAYDVTLLEYIPADIITYHRPAPAAAAVAAGPPPPARTYTVKRGDTLSEIAARLLGNWQRWPEIANLNGVRDPRKLTIGQVLRLP